MKIVDIFSHRNGRDILESPNFAYAFHEFLSVLRGLPPYRAEAVKKTSVRHIIAPLKMNAWLEKQLCIDRDWEWHPLVINADPSSGSARSLLRSDFRRTKIEVEVQFGNVARFAYDVYKMAISMALGNADVGISVVASKQFASIIGGNIAYYQRAVRELERSRLTLIVPLVVIGIEPESWDSSAYPPESEAPIVTAAMVNDARKARGQQPTVLPEPGDKEGEEEMSLLVLRRIMSRIA